MFDPKSKARLSGSTLASVTRVRREPDRANSGFSLVETLVAVLILATALTSLAQLLTTAASATATAGRMTDAALLAAQKVEDLRASSWTAREGGGLDTPTRGVSRQWSISPLPSDPDHVAIIEVVVNVGDSAVHFVSLRTVTP